MAGSADESSSPSGDPEGCSSCWNWRRALSAEVKLFRGFAFAFTLVFTLLLFLSFYLFYLRLRRLRRRSPHWSEPSSVNNAVSTVSISSCYWLISIYLGFGNRIISSRVFMISYKSIVLLTFSDADSFSKPANIFGLISFISNYEQEQADLGLKKELREMLPIIVFKESFSVTDTLWVSCFFIFIIYSRSLDDALHDYNLTTKIWRNWDSFIRKINLTM